MRRLLLPTLAFFLSTTVMAAEITCFSGKTRIYHGYGNFVTFSDSEMSFVETKTQHVILVTGECLITTRIKQGENFYAMDLRNGD